MAFPIEGLTFGDFSTLTADEYKDLLGTGNKDDHCPELPWDEEENLMSVLLPLQQGATVTPQRFIAGAQHQATTQQAPQQQQQQPTSYQQQQQQLQQPQVSISPQQPQIAVAPQQQHVQHQQGNVVGQQPREAAVPTQYGIDRQTVAVTAHPTPDTSHATQVRPVDNNSQVFIQPAQPKAVQVTVQAEVYAEKMEEGAQSSDGGNNTDEDGKKRRNKKRRDPNYYKTFYENPALYNSQDNAYYADNESSSGSSGNTSEVQTNAQETMPDSVIIDMMPNWQVNPNMPAQGVVNVPQNPAVHIQPDNRTSGIHQGYVTHPAAYSQNGAAMINQQTVPVVGQPQPPQQQQQHASHAPVSHGPPGLQHSAEAAAAAAIQLQKSQSQPYVMPATPTTTNVQNVINYEQRTIPPDVNQQAVPTHSNTTIPPQSVKTADNVNIPTVQRYVLDTTVNSTLNTANNMRQNESAHPGQVPLSSAPVASPVQASIAAPMSPPPHASSSTSASPGSTTPIASPMTTPVASPQPPAMSPQPDTSAQTTSPEAVVSETLPAAETETSAAVSAPAAASSAAPAETTQAVESDPAAAEQSPSTEAAVTEQPQSAAPAPAASAWSKPTSWAGLFKSSSASAPLIITTPYENSTGGDRGDLYSEQQNNRSPVSPDDDPRAKELADILSHVTLSNRNAFLRPRGLTNTGNWCYINSILQALVACPPLTNLIRALPIRSSKQQSQEASSTPMLNALVQFFQQFQPVPPKFRDKTRGEIRPGPSFEPTMIYRMLSAVNISLAVKQGRQEDAEEFLSCLLNGLHEEMLAVMGSVKENKPAANSNGPADSHLNNKHVDGNHVNDHEEQEDDDEDEWEQVGPKNKSSVTRGAHFTQTPLSRIFGGQMRSALHQQGSRESATLQPFFTLQLDIQDEKIWSVRDALDNLGLRESLQGFTCNKTKQEVEASRRITLEELPPVLVLHLKCFVYDKTGGCQKLIKKLDYNMDLEISKDLASPTLKARASLSQRSFKLMAVIYHVGKEASGGHYITDIFHSGLNTWMRMDDSNVRFIKGHQVVKPQSSLTPYLLFYRRKDCAEQS